MLTTALSLGAAVSKAKATVNNAHFVNMKRLTTNDRCGGIFASQVIQLIGNIYSQTMRIYICGGRPLSYHC